MLAAPGLLFAKTTLAPYCIRGLYFLFYKKNVISLKALEHDPLKTEKSTLRPYRNACAAPRDISWTKPSTYAIRASVNHQKETMDVLFTHKWTWAHQKRRSDQRNTGSGTIQTIWAV